MQAFRFSAQRVLQLAKRTLSTEGYTRLPSGVRVATSGLQSAYPTVGIVVSAGSRFEKKDSLGASLYLEHLLMMEVPTAQPEFSSYVKLLDFYGAEGLRVTRDRENLVYSVSAPEKNISQIIQVLSAVVSTPFFTEYNLSSVRPSVLRIAATPSTDTLLDESLHREVYRGQPLGNLLYPSHALENVSSKVLNSFRVQSVRNNQVSVIGVGVSHDLLRDAASKPVKSPFAFESDTQPFAPTNTPVEASKYTGGAQLRQQSSSPTSSLSLIVAYQGEPFGYSEHALAQRVLGQVLGNFSRYRSTNDSSPPSSSFGQLASNFEKNPAVSSANVFARSYRDTGLFGISVTATSSSSSSSRLPHEVVTILRSLADSVGEEDVTRAKKTLTTRLLAASREQQFHLLASQASLHQQGDSNQIRSVERVAEALRSVNTAAVRDAAQRLLSSKPTVVAVGDVLSVESL